MTEFASPTARVSTRPAASRRDIGIKRRYAAERRFRAFGFGAIAIGLFFLAVLLWSVVSKGYTAFQQTTITLPIEFSEKVIDPKNERATDPKQLFTANYPLLVREALVKQLGLDPAKRPLVKQATDMVSASARSQLRDIVVADPTVIGKTIPVTLLADANIDSAFKGQIDLTVDEARRKVKDEQVAWMNTLAEEGVLKKSFNTGIFTFGASSRPEAAGVGVALLGSLYMMLIVLVLSLPIGVAASIYLGRRLINFDTISSRRRALRRRGSFPGAYRSGLRCLGTV